MKEKKITACEQEDFLGRSTNEYFRGGRNILYIDDDSDHSNVSFVKVNKIYPLNEYI